MTTIDLAAFDWETPRTVEIRGYDDRYEMYVGTLKDNMHISELQDPTEGHGGIWGFRTFLDAEDREVVLWEYEVDPQDPNAYILDPATKRPRVKTVFNYEKNAAEPQRWEVSAPKLESFKLRVPEDNLKLRTLFLHTGFKNIPVDIQGRPTGHRMKMMWLKDPISEKRTKENNIKAQETAIDHALSIPKAQLFGYALYLNVLDNVDKDLYSDARYKERELRRVLEQLARENPHEYINRTINNRNFKQDVFWVLATKHPDTRSRAIRDRIASSGGFTYEPVNDTPIFLGANRSQAMGYLHESPIVYREIIELCGFNAFLDNDFVVPEAPKATESKSSVEKELEELRSLVSELTKKISSETQPEQPKAKPGPKPKA